MKETSPEDYKKLEQTVELSNFNPKGKKGHADGGRAGFYTGGITDVEPRLDDIGHGSDSLMSRTRLMSPGSQATTSTGLNYLLAEDNDNIRVPFSGGNTVRDKIIEMKKHFKDLKKNYPKSQISYKDFKLKYIPENFAEGGRIGFSGGNGVADEDAEKAALGKRVRELMDDGFDFGEAVKKAMSEGYAEGGRIGFKFGGDAGRRAFLKLMGGVGAGIAGLKTGLLSLGGKGATKQVAKELTSVPIGNAEGMPAWFKPLVNKIIKEGDDVTKKLSTKEREIVHTKKIDEFEEVTVYQDLNTGNVRLEYGPHLTDDTGKVIRASNEPEVVHLEYKASEVIEPDLTTGKGGGRTKEQFSAAESEPEIVNWEGDIEMSGINEVNKVDDLITDTSKLQKYATGNKLTIKELSDSMNKQKYKNKLETDQLEQINYIEKKQGMSGMEYIDEGARVGDFDPKGYRDYDTRGMSLPYRPKIKKADGGRIGFRVGGSGKKFIEKIFGKGSLDVMKARDPEMHKGMLEVVEMFRNRDKSGLVEYMQNFLPHMSKKEIQAFIKGDAVDIAGQGKYGIDNIQGQLIRLGSGRDYAGKIKMIKDAENMRALDKLDVDKMKPNANGGLQTMLGE